MEELGNLPKAEAYCREYLMLLRQRNADPLTEASTQTILGRILLAQGKAAEAETELRPALAVRDEKLPDDWRTQLTRSLLGCSLLVGGAFAGVDLPGSGSRWTFRRDGQGSTLPETCYESLAICANLARS